MSQDDSWKRVATLDALPMGVLKAVKVDDTSLVLLRTPNGVRAFTGKCPHKGAPLDQGVVCASRFRDAQIVCPWHKATFSAETGRLIEPPALDAIKAYPVEIRGDDVFVQKQPIMPVWPEIMRKHERVAIVGAGAAAIAAASTLRKSGFGGSIKLISPEKELPYDRTALSKVALSKNQDDFTTVPLRSAAWFEAYNIERVQGFVSRLNVERRIVFLNDDERIEAEHILLASGSTAQKLPIIGANLPGVFTLRNASDAHAIVADTDENASAILIGGGLIIMEAAAALRRRGVGVTIVSRSEFPFQSQFGSEIGERLRRLHEGKGVAFLGGMTVQEIQGDERVASVKLQDGTELRASIVLIGVGAKPALHYANDLPISEDGGLEVDERMRFAPGIFAAGDIASFLHKGSRYRVEHWRTAQSQGQIAARAMLGLPVNELSPPWFWTQQYDRKLEWVGWPRAFDRVEIDGDLENFDFLARLKQGEKTVALLGAGRPNEIGRAAVSFDDA